MIKEKYKQLLLFHQIVGMTTIDETQVSGKVGKHQYET